MSEIDEGEQFLDVEWMKFVIGKLIERELVVFFHELPDTVESMPVELSATAQGDRGRHEVPSNRSSKADILWFVSCRCPSPENEDSAHARDPKVSCGAKRVVVRLTEGYQMRMILKRPQQGSKRG